MYKKKIKKYLERYTIPPYDQERFIGLIIEAKKKGIHFEKEGVKFSVSMGKILL